MSMNDELVRMATISNIMLLRERLGKERLSFEELNVFSDDALRHGRDTLLKQYNILAKLKPDGCIIEPDGTIKSDCITKEGDE